MGPDVPKFIELYCPGEKATKNAEQCTSLNKIQVDILRIKAQKLVERADKEGGKEALALYEKGGTAYFEMFRKYCQDPVAARQPPQAEKCDEIAYNAARAFQAARLVAKAITVRRALLAYDEKHEAATRRSRRRRRYEIGGNYQAIAVYDLAAEWYERYAKADPNAPRRRQGARRRRHPPPRPRPGGAGDRGRADVHARTTAARSRRRRPRSRSRSAPTTPRRRSGTRRAARSPASMGVIDKAAPDVQVQAHATLARAFIEAQRQATAHAKGEYAKVRGLWTDPAAAEAADPRARTRPRTTAQQDRRLARRSTPSARRSSSPPRSAARPRSIR